MTCFNTVPEHSFSGYSGPQSSPSGSWEKESWHFKSLCDIEIMLITTNIFSMPGSTLNTSDVLIHWILTATLWHRDQYYPCFIYEGIVLCMKQGSYLLTSRFLRQSGTEPSHSALWTQQSGCGVHALHHYTALTPSATAVSTKQWARALVRFNRQRLL